MSSVSSPQTSFRVSAERASGDRIGWAAMKIRPRRSSARSPSTSSARSCSTTCGLVAATRCTLLRWVSRRRIRSTARYRAVVCSQAAGLSGTPSCRHFSIAATNVSCASSSAVSRSPTNRASRASTRGDSTRHKVATVASMFAAFMAVVAVAESGPGATGGPRPRRRDVRRPAPSRRGGRTCGRARQPRRASRPRGWRSRRSAPWPRRRGRR